MKSLIQFLSILLVTLVTQFSYAEYTIKEMASTPSGKYYEREFTYIYGPGDEIEINGEKLTIQRILGHGDFAQVYLLSNGLALRLNYRSYQNEAESWINGHKQLSAYQVPVPKLYLEKSNPNSYVTVEYIDIKYGLTDFITKYHKLPEHERQQLEQAFIEFLKKIAPFELISDFHYGQMAYNPSKGWLLLDFKSDSFLAKESRNSPAMDPISYIFRHHRTYFLNRGAIQSTLDHLGQLTKETIAQARNCMGNVTALTSNP